MNYPLRASPKDLQDWGVTPRAVQPSPNESVSVEVLPPLAYQGLRTGPDFGIEYEEAEALPISAADPLLRGLSPFVIRVEPPLVFNNLPPPETANRARYVGIFEAAAAGAGSSFSGARSRIQQAPYTQLGYGGSVDEYLARNSTGVQRQKSADGMAPPNAQDGSGRLAEPAIADLQVAVDIALQLSAVANTPPLVLLINPQSLQKTFTKVQQFTDRSRHGKIFQAWGEDQPKLAISARIGAFISGGRGVQFASRRDSASWQNLMTVFQFYKNNGYIHDTVGRSNAHHHVGVLSIRYDQWVYYGQMDSFSFTQDESNMNGGVTFEMQFTAVAMEDTAPKTTVVRPMKSPIPSLSDPRYAGEQNRAAREPGALYLGAENVQSVPALASGGGGPVLSSGRVTSRRTNDQGFQAPDANTRARPQQAAANSRSLAVPFTLARSGVNIP